jgi:hypothetical protein
MSWSAIRDEFTIDDVGARLLSNLARGIYSHEAVLREYVQNACDAYDDLPAMPDHAAIHIDLESDDTIAVQDNGIGMDLKGVRDAKKIAVSPKAGLERIGFRGIGIWAGFQACDRLEVDTTKVGTPKRYRLQIDFAEILKHVDADINIKTLLDGRFRIHEEAAAAHDHYTRVRLIGLHGDYKKLATSEELRRIVSQVLPCKVDPQFKHFDTLNEILLRLDAYQEFSILVDGGEVFKQFPNDVAAPVEVVLRKDAEEYGRAWYCMGERSLTPSAFQFRNFRLRIHNFAVGRVGIYDDEDGTAFGITSMTKLASRAHLNWHVGEIHMTHSDIKPDTPRSALELDALSRRAVESIRAFYDDRVADSRAFSEFKTRRDDVDECKRLVESGELTAARDKFLTSLQEQESMVRGRKPTQKVKVKLRDLLNRPDLKKDRQKLLRAIGGQSASAAPHPTAGKPEETVAERKAQESAGQQSVSPQSNDRTTLEDLLSELIAAVERVLGDDRELVEEVIEAMAGVFRSRGLLSE